jgi:hypothetical protein
MRTLNAARPLRLECARTLSRSQGKSAPDFLDGRNHGAACSAKHSGFASVRLARFDVTILGQFMSFPEVCAGGGAMWIHSRAVASDCACGEPRMFALPVILQTLGKHHA